MVLLRLLKKLIRPSFWTIDRLPAAGGPAEGNGRAGDGDDDIDDYRDEVDSMDSDDISVDYSDIIYSPATRLEDEEAILSQLIQEAKSCMLHEVDAKAEFLTQKIKSATNCQA